MKPTKMKSVITIISGLPRTGTSMMMRMLEYGGIKVVTDHKRQADEDNPKGYYEFEKVKKIKEDTSWLPSTRGSVFKMVSMLLYDLPTDENYNIVFMKRDIAEILISQRKMLERQNPEQKDVDYEKMGKLYRKHLKHIEPWLNQQYNMDVLFISYNDIIANPREHLNKVNLFLGKELYVDKMLEVVDKSLYRNRSNDINEKN